MKKIILLLGISAILSSCSIVGGTIGAAGSVVGGALSAGGKVIGGLIGGKNGEIKAKDAKYKFSDVEVLVEDNLTTVTGSLSHNGATKENLTIAVPCFNNKNVKMGDAIDTVSILEKNQKWDFTATLNEGDVKYCKINDTYITINSENY